MQAQQTNGCTSQKLDGNTIARMNILECQRKTAETTNNMLRRAHEKAVSTFNKEISKGPGPKDGQCIEKATQGADRCMLASIIDVAVKRRKYNLSENGNLTVLYDEDDPIAARVNVNYKIIAIETPRKREKTIIDHPAKRRMYFNKIGQLIGAEGDFTPEDKEEGCKPCDPAKKTVETSSKKCNLGCQLRGTPALVSTSIQKRTKKNKNGKEKNESASLADENPEEEQADISKGQEEDKQPSNESE